MKTNINIELFKRYQPKRKLEMIDNLTTDELFAISPDTMKRIIKEAGTNFHNRRTKHRQQLELYYQRNRAYQR